MVNGNRAVEWLKVLMSIVRGPTKDFSERAADPTDWEQGRACQKKYKANFQLHLQCTVLFCCGNPKHNIGDIFFITLNKTFFSLMFTVEISRNIEIRIPVINFSFSFRPRISSIGWYMCLYTASWSIQL